MTPRPLEILLVDDLYADHFARKFSVALGDKIHCTPVDSGKKALEAVKEKCYDLIILDYQMPEKDGAETAKAIRREFPEARIVGFSYDWPPEEVKLAGLEYCTAWDKLIIEYLSRLVEASENCSGEFF